MARVVYNTSIFIAYKPAIFPAGFLMSTVVLKELTAGANDKSDLQKLDAARRHYEKEGKLLVPDAEDWWLAGKIPNSLLRGLKSQSGGQTPKLPFQEKQRIIRDVLIARTAHRAGVLLVTNNLDDFRKIRRFCNVRISPGKEFFRQG